jgi:hypothetical protein
MIPATVTPDGGHLSYTATHFSLVTFVTDIMLHRRRPAPQPV